MQHGTLGHFQSTLDRKEAVVPQLKIGFPRRTRVFAALSNPSANVRLTFPRGRRKEIAFKPGLLASEKGHQMAFASVQSCPQAIPFLETSVLLSSPTFLHLTEPI